MSIIDVQQKVATARSAEKFFGIPQGNIQIEQLQWLKNIYRDTIRMCHPDKNPGAEKLAEHLSATINNWYKAAGDRIRSGTYGQEVEILEAEPDFQDLVISTTRADYQVLKHLAVGDWTNVYLGKVSQQGLSEQVCIKIVQNISDNDLIENNRTVLTRLNQELEAIDCTEATWPLPTLLDYFQLEDGRAGIVTRYIESSDLVIMREIWLNNWRANPNNFRDHVQNHLCWIMERLLSALGFLHSRGVIMANIQPANILIRPQDHSAYFLGFSLSFLNPKESDTIRGYAEHYTAPEALNKARDKRPPIQQWDLYSLGKCIVYLLGGDTITGKISSHIAKRMDEKVIRFVGRMLRENPLTRTSDAWKAYDELANLREEVLGARHEFLEFPVTREYQTQK